MSGHGSRATRTALITGGAGFVGTNVADRLAREGWHVRLLDNLSRAGVAGNVEWLRGVHGDRVELLHGDIRDQSAVRDALRGVARVFHFAAQVAVTTSVCDPMLDFDINARGTLNLLNAMRRLPAPPSLLFTSTNKVYGELDDLCLTVSDKRYAPAQAQAANRGIDESRHLHFHSPYGCSKGAGDQYVLDYARTFALPAVVFRMSCIYGPHQLGTEDQGWVAHFVIRALRQQPLIVYGDGRQVRDVLFVDDLVDAMLQAHERIDRTAGEAFNVGGGPDNTLSLLELLDMLEELFDRPPAYTLEPWRVADQRYYVSNVGKLQRMTGWAPRVTVRDGLQRLIGWLAGEARLPSPELRQVAS